MAFADFPHLKAHGRQQRTRLLVDFLAMLQRTSRVIGDCLARRDHRGFQRHARQHFGDVLGQRRNARRPRRPFGIVLQHEAVVFYHRAAARGRR